jgi:hypothetical protein
MRKTHSWNIQRCCRSDVIDRRYLICRRNPANEQGGECARPRGGNHSAPSHEVGDDVTVRYDPDHPLDARIKSFGSSALMWVLPGITGILGLAFLGAVIAVRKLMPPTE